jgi:hypothetical protein
LGTWPRFCKQSPGSQTRFLYFGCRVAENVSAIRGWRKLRQWLLARDLRLFEKNCASSKVLARPKNYPETALIPQN